MGFPICDSCASSGTLCPECVEKVRKGDISELEVLLSTILANHGLSGYESVLDLGTKLVIFANDEQAHELIGIKGRTAAEVSRKLGKRVAVIVRGWDEELLIKSIARPSRIIGMNKVYREDGKEVLKLIFDKPLDEGSIGLMKELVGEVEIGYKKDETHPHMRGTDR